MRATLERRGAKRVHAGLDDVQLADMNGDRLFHRVRIMQAEHHVPVAPSAGSGFFEDAANMSATPTMAETDCYRTSPGIVAHTERAVARSARRPPFTNAGSGLARSSRRARGVRWRSCSPKISRRSLAVSRCSSPRGAAPP